MQVRFLPPALVVLRTRAPADTMQIISAAIRGDGGNGNRDGS